MTRTYVLFAATLLAAGAARAEPTSEIFFDFDSAVLRGELPDLAPFARWLDEHPMGRVVLEGHCDPRGTEAYNIGLSARRAEAVRDALIAAGAPSERIVLAMYGEDAPPRESYAEARRVTIETADRPLYTIVDDRLGEATALVWSEPVTLAELEGPPPAEQVARP